MAMHSTVANRSIKVTYNIPGAANVTMMGWFYVSALTGGNQGLLAIDATISDAHVNSSGNFEYISGNGTGSLTTTVGCPTGVWFHKAFVQESLSTTDHRMYGYLNGRLIGTFTDTASYANSSILVVPNDNYAVNGYFEDIRCWSNAHNGQQVWDEMHAGSPVHRGGLTVWSPFYAPNDTWRNFGQQAVKWVAVGGATPWAGIGGRSRSLRRRGRV
jgi:hypothetical protein